MNEIKKRKKIGATMRNPVWCRLKRLSMLNA